MPASNTLGMNTKPADPASRSCELCPAASTAAWEMPARSAKARKAGVGSGIFLYSCSEHRDQVKAMAATERGK